MHCSGSIKKMNCRYDNAFPLVAPCITDTLS